MKKLILSASLAAALCFPSLMLAQGATSQTTTMPPKSTSTSEKHPEIQKAIEHLERAKNILQNKAAHDFGGHRNAAIKSIDEALEHLHQAMQSDK